MIKTLDFLIILKILIDFREGRMLWSTTIESVLKLPGNFCRGMPFALKGDWQLGNRMIFVLFLAFLAKFHSHLAWQSQCNGLPPSCNKLSERIASSFKTRFRRLQCSKLRDSKPDIPVKELAGNSEMAFFFLF